MRPYPTMVGVGAYCAAIQLFAVPAVFDRFWQLFTATSRRLLITD
ncbi:MAG TPA: hypothetical protein VHL11_17155 [Phototrophicaceae bacterium]|nr:hypothetical protein [Phototrophicaceae bacterium]